MTMQDFPELLKQVHAGLITEVEFILQMQLSENQVKWMIAAQQLPYQAFMRIKLTDFEHDDPRIEVAERQMFEQLAKKM